MINQSGMTRENGYGDGFPVSLATLSTAEAGSIIPIPADGLQFPIDW
jgi:hypothetical protein